MRDGNLPLSQKVCLLKSEGFDFIVGAFLDYKYKLF